jgi:hypothetical protein
MFWYLLLTENVGDYGIESGRLSAGFFAHNALVVANNDNF